MLQPLNDRVLIHRLPEPLTGLILLPEIAEQPSFRGEVLAVGPGRRSKSGKRIPCDVVPGDIVYFGTLTDFDRDDLVMIQEMDIRFKVAN